MEISFSDITWEEKIAYQNVVSSRKKFHYSEMAEEFKVFVSKIVEEGYTLKGPFFYSLNNIPMDEIVDIEMFFPIYENQFMNTEKTSNFQFHSYFEIGSVFKGIVAEDFENRTEQIYAELLYTLETNDLEINTPFFHVPAKDGAKYMYIYLGYVSKELVLKMQDI